MLTNPSPYGTGEPTEGGWEALPESEAHCELNAKEEEETFSKFISLPGGRENRSEDNSQEDLEC